MYTRAAQIIKDAEYTITFTGAGISVESGIPPFRGEGGLWSKYDPKTFEIQYFKNYPRQSWGVIRQIFYELLGNVRPNPAHWALAELEANNLLKSVITQNIDSLHHEAGSKQIHEFHGSLRKLVCIDCKKKYALRKIDLNLLPPRCEKCQGILKPDIVFFGEPIPENVEKESFNIAKKADCIILIGTTGKVVPANMIPVTAKSNGAFVIEINTSVSEYTETITDIFFQEQAGTAMENLMEEIDNL